MCMLVFEFHTDPMWLWMLTWQAVSYIAENETFNVSLLLIRTYDPSNLAETETTYYY